jgi:hypothetical protein
MDGASSTTVRNLVKSHLTSGWSNWKTIKFHLNYSCNLSNSKKILKLCWVPRISWSQSLHSDLEHHFVCNQAGQFIAHPLSSTAAVPPNIATLKGSIYLSSQLKTKQAILDKFSIWAQNNRWHHFRFNIKWPKHLVHN